MAARNTEAFFEFYYSFATTTAIVVGSGIGIGGGSGTATDAPTPSMYWLSQYMFLLNDILLSTQKEDKWNDAK